MSSMSMKELLEIKHPTAWIEFEKGLINEVSFSNIWKHSKSNWKLVGPFDDT